MFLGVVKHGRADTVFPAGAMEYVNIYTPFAAAPEGFVVCQVGKGHGLVAKLGVHLHHRSTAGQRENLCVRPAGSGQRERHVFNLLGNA